MGPRRVRGMATSDTDCLGEGLLKRVELAEKHDVHSARLSGCQQQRVARNPEIVGQLPYWPPIQRPHRSHRRDRLLIGVIADGEDFE